MKRAAVLIGVDRTGDLPPLEDAARCARRVEKWAQDQKFNFIKTFTDENDGAVKVVELKQLIDEIVKDGTTEQLLIYFAGHGVNIRYNELWLLTDSPRDRQEAVNVRGSADTAERCGIPHVVFISDACRTAATGRLAFMDGSEIFPNEDNQGQTENPVDRFYACALGRPSLEVRDSTSAVREFKAVYTAALLDGLSGKIPQLLDWTNEGGQSIGLVRPRPLKKILATEVPRRIAHLQIEAGFKGPPDAHIASDETAWIARISRDGGMPGAGAPFVPSLTTPEVFSSTRTTWEEVKFPASMATVSSSLLQGVISNSRSNRTDHETFSAPDSDDGFPSDAPSTDTLYFSEIISPTATQLIDEAVAGLSDSNVSAPGLTEFVSVAIGTSTPFGPTHHETHCGFKIRGDRFVDVFTVGARAELFEIPGNVIRLENVRFPGTSVVLHFESGLGAVLPAIPGYLCGLTILDGELVDVAYEPSENDYRWSEFEPHAAEIRALRAIASASTRDGIFRLEGEQPLSIARKMQFFKGVDPALAIYAAYAYHDLQRRDLIREMIEYMTKDLGACLFDLALLGRILGSNTVGASPSVLSFFPLLSQGWALLGAERVKYPPSLKYLRESLVPSVWTLFNRDGQGIIRNALQNGDIQ